MKYRLPIKRSNAAWNMAICKAQMRAFANGASVGFGDGGGLLHIEMRPDAP